MTIRISAVTIGAAPRPDLTSQIRTALPGVVVLEFGALDDLALGSANAARIFGLDAKGALRVGADADLVLIDPNRVWTLDVSRWLTRSPERPRSGTGGR